MPRDVLIGAADAVGRALPALHDAYDATGDPELHERITSTTTEVHGLAAYIARRAQQRSVGLELDHDW